MGISAVIITFNEERNIERCIRSLEGVADEIIVIDSLSTDRTRSICEGFPNLRFLSNPWPGYGQQKNFGIGAASHEYILSLDADEALDEALRASLLSQTAAGLQGLYECCRLNYYYGRFMKHGFEYPDWKTRLFPKNTARWNENPVHEMLVTRNNLVPVRLKGHLLHYTYYSIDEHIRQANRYTTLAAEASVAKGKKASWFKILFSPGFTFFQSYVLKAGFLDGGHGFIVAMLHAHATFLKYAKGWEAAQKKNDA